MTYEFDYQESCGNVFLDIGFSPAEAGMLTAKTIMKIRIERLIEHRKLTQKKAAVLCGTDQQTYAKLKKGGIDSITIDQLISWLTALGQDVQITITPTANLEQGHLQVTSASA